MSEQPHAACGERTQLGFIVADAFAVCEPATGRKESLRRWSGGGGVGLVQGRAYGNGG